MNKNNPIETCDKLFYVEAFTLDGAETPFKKLVCGVKALQKIGIDPAVVADLKPDQLADFKTSDRQYQIEMVSPEGREHFLRHADGFTADDLITESVVINESFSEDKEMALELIDDIIQKLDEAANQMSDLGRIMDRLPTEYNMSGNLAAYVTNYIASNGRDAILDKMGEYKNQIEAMIDEEELEPFEYKGYQIYTRPTADEPGDWEYEAKSDDAVEVPEFADSGFGSEEEARSAAMEEIDGYFTAGE